MKGSKYLPLYIGVLSAIAFAFVASPAMAEPAISSVYPGRKSVGAQAMRGLFLLAEN